MKLKTGAWVLVADGSHAIVFENVGTAQAPDLKALQVYDQDNPRTHELGSDKPPRAFQSVGTRRSAQEAPDYHQANEDRFVSRIIEDLDKKVAEKAFKEIVIFAPPVALGRMRRAASADLVRRVVVWVDKDLTKHPVPDITSAVMKALED